MNSPNGRTTPGSPLRRSVVHSFMCVSPRVCLNATLKQRGRDRSREVRSAYLTRSISSSLFECSLYTSLSISLSISMCVYRPSFHIAMQTPYVCAENNCGHLSLSRSLCLVSKLFTFNAKINSMYCERRRDIQKCVCINGMHCDGHTVHF